MSIKSLKTYFFFVIILITLIGLGVWQILRLYEKDNYINSVLASTAVEPKKLNEENIKKKYENVIFDGEVLYDKIFWLYRRHPLAKYKDGAYLVAPIKLGNGIVLLSAIGWFETLTFAEAIDELKNNPKISIKGLIVPSEKNSVLIPKNDYVKKIIFTIDVSDLSNQIGIKPTEFFVAANDFIPKLKTNFLPITPQMMIKIRNDHMEYAATWFCLAAAWCFMFFYFIRKKY